MMPKRGPLVMVVNLDIAQRRQDVNAIRLCGYSLQQAEDAERAQQFFTEEVEIVVAEYDLGQMTASALRERLVETENRPDLPFIIFTNDSNALKMNEQRRNGAIVVPRAPGLYKPLYDALDDLIGSPHAN